MKRSNARQLSASFPVIRKAERAPAPDEFATLRIVSVVGLDPSGRPLVRASTEPSPRVAETTVRIGLADVGRRATLAFADGDASRPIITGLLIDPSEARSERIDVLLDGDRLTLSACKEIVLRCGNASLVLSADGNVRVRGENIASNARGKQRIRGASVKIN